MMDNDYRRFRYDSPSVSPAQFVTRRRTFLKGLLAGLGVSLGGAGLIGWNDSAAAAPSSVHDTGYLQATMARADADPEERKFILAGLHWLDGTARQDGGHPFATWDTDRQTQLVQHMQASKDGENWLALVLYYVFEALLTDPVYGGNTNGVGWKWLDYIPGFPRPPVGKRYYELMGR
jgi:gluconate 2-dehydrogenase gamma chain